MPQVVNDDVGGDGVVDDDGGGVGNANEAIKRGKGAVAGCILMPKIARCQRQGVIDANIKEKQNVFSVDGTLAAGGRMEMSASSPLFLPTPGLGADKPKM